MKKILIYITGICLAAAAAGCSNDPGKDQGKTPELDPIVISSDTEEGADPTPAADVDGQFPNGGRIGIIAARYPDTTPNEDWAPDWQDSYPDIDNALASQSGYDPGTETYKFQWDRQRYWPFDGGKLIFMAYSPYTDNTGAIDLDVTREWLVINLTDPMADVLYASNNVKPWNVYSKSPNQTVDLGTFKHVMSQLTVIVESDPTMEPTIELSALSVITLRPEAQFHLPSGDEGLFVAEEPDLDRFQYDIRTETEGLKPFYNDPFSGTVLLFPGTEEWTTIHFELVDTNAPANTYRKTVAVTFFAPSDFEPITLQRGKNTKLTIRVKSITASQQDFELEGQITDWIPGGSFHIDIK